MTHEQAEDVAIAERELLIMKGRSTDLLLEKDRLYKEYCRVSAQLDASLNGVLKSEAVVTKMKARTHASHSNLVNFNLVPGSGTSDEGDDAPK